MQIIKDLIQSLPDQEVLDVRIGLHWTAVVVDQGGVPKCGLSSTLVAGGHDHHESGPDVPQAGQLLDLSGRQLAELALAGKETLRSVGMAAINALLPQQPKQWVDANAEEMIARHGAGEQVALIGHFPFIPSLRERVGHLTILELSPKPGDLAADQAHRVIPQSKVLAITSMTFPNHTLEDLLALRAPDSLVIMLGPTTPLTPLLFDYGIDILSGSVVEEVESILHMVSQGASFRQMHQAGVRLVNMARPGIHIPN